RRATTSGCAGSSGGSKGPSRGGDEPLEQQREPEERQEGEPLQRGATGDRQQIDQNDACEQAGNGAADILLTGPEGETEIPDYPDQEDGAEHQAAGSVVALVYEPGQENRGGHEQAGPIAERAAGAFAFRDVAQAGDVE